jgi:hypothetical protein
MVGSFGLAIGLFVVGLIAAVALPGAGLVLGVILIVAAILIAIGGVTAGRRRAPTSRV